MKLDTLNPSFLLTPAVFGAALPRKLRDVGILDNDLVTVVSMEITCDNCTPCEYYWPTQRWNATLVREFVFQETTRLDSDEEIYRFDGSPIRRNEIAQELASTGMEIDFKHANWTFKTPFPETVIEYISGTNQLLTRESKSLVARIDGNETTLRAFELSIETLERVPIYGLIRYKTNEHLSRRLSFEEGDLGEVIYRIHVKTQSRLGN